MCFKAKPYQIFRALVEVELYGTAKPEKSPGSLDLPTELALSPGSQLHGGAAVSSVRWLLGQEAGFVGCKSSA